MQLFVCCLQMPWEFPSCASNAQHKSGWRKICTETCVLLTKTAENKSSRPRFPATDMAEVWHSVQNVRRSVCVCPSELCASHVLETYHSMAPLVHADSYFWMETLVGPLQLANLRISRQTICCPTGLTSFIAPHILISF